MRVLGITDERDACDCCGRAGLKRVVVLDKQNGDEPVFYGVTCAAMALGRTTARVEREATNANAAARVTAWEAARDAWLDSDTHMITRTGKARTIRRSGVAWIILDENGAALDTIAQKSAHVARLVETCGWVVTGGPVAPPATVAA